MMKELEKPGTSLSSVAQKFGISVSSMSRMKKMKYDILQYSADRAGLKRIRDCKEPEVACLLYEYFMKKKNEGIHLTGAKLKEKASQLAKQMGREFKASSGWLGRWKQRYNLVVPYKKGDKSGHNPIIKTVSCQEKSNTFICTNPC